MYATLKDLHKRFDENKLNRLGNATEQMQALQDASARIDGFIGGAYTLPLTSPPDVLVGLCCDIARYLLHDDNVPEPVQKRFDDALALLGKYGDKSLQLLPPSDTANSGSNLAEIQSAPTVFGRDNSKEFL